MERILRTVGLALLAAAIIGSATGRGLAAETIKVGVILPLTGSRAASGQMAKQSLALAFEEINARRAQQGEEAVEVLIEDDSGRPERARSAAGRLIKGEKVLMLTGPLASATAWVVAPIANTYRVPLLLTSAAADKITEQGWDYVFRISRPASERPLGLVSFLEEAVKTRTAAVLHDTTLQGLKEARLMKGLLKDLGFEVVLAKGYRPGTEDFSALLEEVRGKAPGVLYLASGAADGALLVKQAKQAGMNATLFVGGGRGFTSADFYHRAGGAAQHLVAPALWTPSVSFQGAEAFVEKYKARFKRVPDHHGAEAYAAAYIIDDVLRRATSKEPDTLRGALAETDLMTVVGPVRFETYGKKTNQNRAPHYILQWVDGRLEVVWPGQFATAKYRAPR